MKLTMEVGGRLVGVEIDDRDRDFNQFCVAVWVDGKERSTMWFTDHREDSAAPRDSQLERNPDA